MQTSASTELYIMVFPDDVCLHYILDWSGDPCNPQCDVFCPKSTECTAVMIFWELKDVVYGKKIVTLLIQPPHRHPPTHLVRWGPSIHGEGNGVLLTQLKQNKWFCGILWWWFSCHNVSFYQMGYPLVKQSIVVKTFQICYSSHLSWFRFHTN